jgi:hypothetical protein
VACGGGGAFVLEVEMKFFALAGLFIWLCIAFLYAIEGDLLKTIAVIFGVVCWIGFLKAVK